MYKPFSTAYLIPTSTKYFEYQSQVAIQ